MRIAIIAIITLIALPFAGCSPGPVCAALPTCEEDEVEVDACDEGDAECREVTVCDSTIFCAPGEGGDGGTGG